MRKLGVHSPSYELRARKHGRMANHPCPEITLGWQGPSFRYTVYYPARLPARHQMRDEAARRHPLALFCNQEREDLMALFMLMAKYSPEATRAIIETGSDREAAARKPIEAAGGKLLGFYGMFGQEYSIAIIVDMPGNAEYIAAIAPAIMSGTLASWKSIPLYTAGDVVKASKIVKKTGAAYSAPGKSK